MEQADARASHLDPYAMKWLFTCFTEDDSSDTDMDKLLEVLPGYIHSHFTEVPPEVLTAPYIPQRIKGHLFTCVSTTGLSEQARIKRVSTCVESLRVILHRFTSGPAPSISRTRTKCHYEHTCKVSSMVSILYMRNQTKSRTCAHFASGLSLSKVS